MHPSGQPLNQVGFLLFSCPSCVCLVSYLLISIRVGNAYVVRLALGILGVHVTHE